MPSYALKSAAAVHPGSLATAPYVASSRVQTIQRGALGDKPVAAVILDGRVPHAMLLEILTDQAYGTMIRSH